MQTTAYPWNGDVRLAINPGTETAFDLNIRIPGWCKGGKPDGSWTPVTGNSEFTVKPDSYNTVHFDPVQTDSLRIEAQLQPNFSGGLLQWNLSE